ncbi:MAG: hypothetical protein RL644_745 [Actinomycetota bacterium]
MCGSRGKLHPIRRLARLCQNDPHANRRAPVAAPDEGQVARAPDDPAAVPAGVVAGTMTGRRDPAGRMTDRPDRAGMMTGRAGSMIVTGRRVRAGMMMTGRVVGDLAVLMTGRRGRAGMMTGRAGSMVVTGRRVRAGMMMTGRVVGDRVATMTGRRGPVGTMTTDPSGRSASRDPRRSVVRRKSVVARVDGARTLSRRDPLNGRSSCGWTRVPPHARSASRPAFVLGSPVARRRAAARRCARSTP